MSEPGKHADVFHAIGDPNRRKLLDLLRTRERSVQALVPHLNITVGAVSQHLKILLQSGLVVRRKEGRFRYYRARPKALKKVHDWTARYRRFWESRLDNLGKYLDEKE